MRRLSFRWFQKPTQENMLHRAFGARVEFGAEDTVICGRCLVRQHPTYRYCTYCGNRLQGERK